MTDCLTCKNHHTQGGSCYQNKSMCLMYKEEPRGKMRRTDLTFSIDKSEDALTPLFKFEEKVIFDDSGKDIEMTVIKINWLNIRTRLCNITVEYHENEKTRFLKKREFGIVKNK